MNKEKIFSLIRELFAPVALILLGALLLFNPDSASALISKLLGWIIVLCAIGCGVAALVDPGKRTGKVVAAVALAILGGWLTKNPLALAAWVGRIVGILLVVDGLQDMAHLRGQGQRFALPVLATLVGAVLILLPLTTTRLVFSLCGIVVLIIGIVMLLDRLKGRKRLSGGDDNIVDAL